MRTFKSEHDCPFTHEGTHVETDRISPHYGHTIASLGDGAWQCETCEGPVSCDGTVLLVYDTGTDPQDFALQDDIVRCDNGHRVSESTLQRWYARDFDRWCDDERDRYEAAREDYWERKYDLWKEREG